MVLLAQQERRIWVKKLFFFFHPTIYEEKARGNIHSSNDELQSPNWKEMNGGTPLAERPCGALCARDAAESPSSSWRDC